MISWALTAIDSTLEHSTTLGKTQIPNFSTLALKRLRRLTSAVYLLFEKYARPSA